MRKIEEQMVKAIHEIAAGQRESWKSGNTSVIKRYNANIVVKLHGNAIAALYPNVKLMHLTDKGFNTPTVRSRLQALGKEFGADFKCWKSVKGQAIALNLDGKDVGDKRPLKDSDGNIINVSTIASFKLKGLENLKGLEMDNSHIKYPRWELKLWQPFDFAKIKESMAQDETVTVRMTNGDECRVDNSAGINNKQGYVTAYYAMELCDHIDEPAEVFVYPDGKVWGYDHYSNAAAFNANEEEICHNPDVKLVVTFSHYGIDMTDFNLPFDPSEVVSYEFNVENKEPEFISGTIEVYADLMTAIIIIQRNKALNSENHFSIHDNI